MDERDEQPIEGTILLVDDEAQILRVVAARLKRAFPRVEVVPAQSGFEAMRLLDTHRIDLIICDHRMPGMDGVSFLSYAQRHAREVGRVVLTGHADAEMAVRAVNDGHVHAFFQKPAVSELFEQHVARLLLARAEGEAPGRPTDRIPTPHPRVKAKRRPGRADAGMLS